MIDIAAKIHDKFSIEFKVGFHVRRKRDQSNFSINTWMFIPNSLDINSLTYDKSHFYRDVKSYIRLITPVFLLREICEGEAIPLKNLERVFHKTASEPTRTAIKEYESQIKMFTAIFKSAIRDEVVHLLKNNIKDDMEYLIASYVESVRNILLKFRYLRKIINVPTISSEYLNYFFFADEYISNLVDQRTCYLIGFLQRKDAGKYEQSIGLLTSLWHDEAAYRQEMKYISVDKDNPLKNREFIFRRSILKKYAESDLFLRARKKKDGVLVEQIYYSLAAGLSMIFATTVAFSFQMKYGNFTMPLFIALVVSYMLKDRIKELMRYYFAHKRLNRYFDNKTEIGIKDASIGWIKEAVDFITEDKVPREVMNMRSRSALVEAENRITDEKIILYRKQVFLDRVEINKNSEYPIAGINDIMRFHLSRFMQKTDNPEEAIYYLNEEGESVEIYGEKIYYLNILMQLQFEDQMDYKRFRVSFTRAGIIRLEELV
ncbi:hypothetical protein PSM36_3274 [Proteiniphilum saccharofermentans]|uniref:Uncharacterized protein n=1 Tax=Proteiniphilum saccharofermentans TaxID=1642647 RepID=A0A1R3T7J8_9BACT|nr:hypothetical protein [Proteiniphilum saccharofermentans]SCD22059.1 hypothetical protein PSM36_3274 [Proteiniphilum saccharofermentans]